MNTKKESVRKDLQVWRREQSHEFVAAATAQIITNCIEIIDWTNVKILHTYLPNHKQHEIDTWLLLRRIWAEHPHVITAAPVMQANTMHVKQITETTTIRESSFGIPEPIGSNETITANMDVVIVPVTGFNKYGYRLGYGLGHYDRFLASLPNDITIGLAYDETEADFPVESHDVPLSYIVTEKRCIRI